jgi:hypothetical protein
MNTNEYKSVAVPTETYEHLKKMAEDNDRSIAGQVRWLVRSAVEDVKKTKTASSAWD